MPLGISKATLDVVRGTANFTTTPVAKWSAGNVAFTLRVSYSLYCDISSMKG
jgi:hypothetical protein